MFRKRTTQLRSNDFRYSHRLNGTCVTYRLLVSEKASSPPPSFLPPILALLLQVPHTSSPVIETRGCNKRPVW